MRLSAHWAPAALLSVIALLCGTAATAAPVPTPTPGQERVPLRRSADAVPGQYIVTLEPAFAATTVLEQLGVSALFTYEKVLSGFAATLTPAQLTRVRGLPGVQAVEENGVVRVDARAGDRRRDRDPRRPGAGRVPALSWGLDRIDQRHLPLDGEFKVAGTGKGVTAYIVDTGIESGNSEFGGRATNVFDAVNDGRAGEDCNGHGTHVAGTTGGANHGVARDVTLAGVRVLNCEGTGDWAGVIAGFDYVAKHAKQPAVMNASLGGAASSAVDTAVNAVAARNVVPVVAAGNSHVDACGVSPARAASAVTVGATNRDDNEATFSNFGRCLSLYAPGVDIVSAKLGGGSVAESGTSMAAPHVTGVAALYKEEHPTASAPLVRTWLAGRSTRNVISPISPSSPNRLLYTGGL
ncbi:S8 family peptidase [Streptomyces sp. NRRL F-5135]|uniref:S8 family peptidase n=1 Tax=Streptomyces sp. NRRL F-5135 TaxID=1463858 RepID=UPI0004C8CFF4|nr:S8 family peptidase [Streptomyces sp. NRRL F-5135]